MAMRTPYEQLNTILRKAEDKRAQRKRRRRILREAGLSSLCLCLIVAAARFLPRFEGTANAGAGERYGSLILSSPFVGYVVIGALSFVLGVCFTLLCLHLRRKERKGEEREKL